MKTASILQLWFVAASLAFSLQVSAQEWAEVRSPNGCLPSAVDAKREDYRSWIKPYTTRLRKGASGHETDVGLTLTVLDGDDLVPDPSRTWLCGSFCCQMRTMYSVSSSGMVSMTRVTPMAVQGGGPDRLTGKELQTIQKLIRDLLQHPPDDHAVLPPAGRRLVLHVEGAKKVEARVYDRADIPSPIMEVLGLIGATSGPIWMDFKPSVRTLEQLGEPPIPVSAIGIRILHHRDPVTNGLRTPTATLALSPDGSMMVTHYFYVNPRTVITDRNGTSIFFAVSDCELDRRGIYVAHAFFTPDSRYLLLLSNLPAIYIYDTKSWKSLTNLPGLPTGATAFYPSSDWKHGVAVLRGGEVEAWDLSKSQKQSDLDLDGNLQDVSFSEDSSLFAASSVHLNPDGSSTFHLRVWDASTGQFLREMIPPYYFEHDVISRPIWWGHGKYLLANVRVGHWGSYMIAVWNVQSGQLRGGFSACDSSQDPFEVGIDGPRLLKWCFDRTLLVWDIPTAVEKVDKFEQTLKGSR
jgi:hypothetical protein